MELLDAWPLHVGWSSYMCDTPPHPEKLPLPHMISLDAPAFRSHCPKPVQIFVLRTGSQLSYAHWLQTAYWGMIIHMVGTSGNAVQCHIISAVLWLGYLQTSLYISIHLHFTFITWVDFAYEGSRFHCKLWEKHDITKEPAITYIYLCSWSYASCSCSFLNGPSITEHVLNWNAREAWKNLHTIGIVSYTGICCLVPFSSNISWLIHKDTTVLARRKETVIFPGTSEVHNNKKFCY
jgi:hypothetical protein